MPTSEMPKIRLFEMRCETHTVSLANSLLMIMASNYLLLMKTLYKLNALNYYNQAREVIITDPIYTYEEIADRLADLKDSVLELGIGITEGSEHYNDYQDLLNTIEVNLDVALHSF